MLVLAPSVRKGVRSLLNASLAAKMLTLLALIAALFLGILLLVYLPTFERELLRDRRASLRQLVEVAHSLLADYHQRVESGELSLSEAQSRAIQHIGKLRYEHNDYFWLSDTNLPFPRLILHPILADLQGVDTDDPRFRHVSQMQFGPEGRIEVFPSGDKNLAQAFVEVALESGDGFVTYAWPTPPRMAPPKRISPRNPTSSSSLRGAGRSAPAPTSTTSKPASPACAPPSSSPPAPSSPPPCSSSPCSSPSSSPAP